MASHDLLTQQLTSLQQRIVSFPRDGGGSLFLRGLPGTGKSIAMLGRLAALLREGRRPYEILVLVPQRAQSDRYEKMLAQLQAPTRGGVEIVTFYSLAQRAVGLFWPLIAGVAGFRFPDREPTFLTIETTQYFMWRLVEPLMTREGYFSSLIIRRGRLLSQLIDNLNKSALVGFDHTDIYRRLKGAWPGDAERVNNFWQAQDCAIRFRQYCLEHNVLDFSLVTELYHRYMLSHPVYQRYFRARYRHLLVDNLEENVPVAHDLVLWAMQQCRSTVLAYDEGGGHRIFLGADARGALEIGERCSEQLTMEQLMEPTADPLALANTVCRSLRLDYAALPAKGSAKRAILGQGPDEGRYWISMVRWVVEQIAALVGKGTPASQIAIIAPYVNEVMRFTIQEQLARRGISLYLLRPSTPFRQDPVVRALLTLAVLSHPQWRSSAPGEPQPLPVEDVSLMLEIALEGLDPIRARHLAQAALPQSESTLRDLSGADSDAHPEGGRSQEELGRLWKIVGYQVRQRYETLRVWLETYAQNEPDPLDIFLSRLFGDLLSQPGYGFAGKPDRARAYGRLVESALKFRSAVALDESTAQPGLTEQDVAREYVELIMGGIASAEYLLDWPEPDQDAIILATAYAYLTRDLRSQVQFWIDLGSDGWWNRPYQPLTHPHVLSRHWPVGQVWTDVDEERSRREALGRVIQGLAARCTRGVYLATSELGLGGEEQTGRLQRIMLTVLTRPSDGALARELQERDTM
jgi:hypothetical protein